ncbi:MAG: hypothetical protein Q8M99_02450 [Methylotenera sp.]|nr:hypothetical protein [Methylotenera sp.]
MSNKLDEKLIEVGYFLSRVGVDDPPSQLNASTWKEAYEKFYFALGDNKPEKQFQNSLKNLRDIFDGYHNNNRAGWKDKDEHKLPRDLPELYQGVFDKLYNLNDSELWAYIRPLAVTYYDSKLANRKSSELKNAGLKYFSSEFSGDKKIRAKSEVDFFVFHGLVVDSLKDFVAKNLPHSLIYNTQKIDLVIELNNKVTAVFEVKTAVDTQSIYTAVGQLLMHSVGYDGIKKYIVLPSSVVSDELVTCLISLDIHILWFEIIDFKCEFNFN